MLKLIAILSLLVYPFTTVPHSTAQQRTSHYISFIDSNDDTYNMCTGTAVGEHVLLTASHCLHFTPDKKLITPSIRLDLTRTNYFVLAHIDDGRDHVLLLLEGPTFKYVDPFLTRNARYKEHTYFYGFGGEYPAHKSIGKVTVIADPDNVQDPSELDTNAGFIETSNTSIQGDSGAAIYGEDGGIVGLVTYTLPNGNTGGFELGFPKDLVKEFSKLGD